MFKKLLITVASLLIIFALLSAVALYNLSTIANANKDYFAALGEAELGRKVSVGSLGVGLVGDISIRAQDVALADDPAFSAEPFARIGELRLTARFWPLLWKELRIKRVTIRQPSITLIRERDGRFNFDSLGPVAPAQAAAPEAKPRTDDKAVDRSAKPKRRMIPPILALGKMTDGTLRYVDRRRGLDLTMRRVDLAVKAADAEGRVPLEIAAAVLADQQNGKVIGKVGPLIAGAPLAELPIELRLELAPLDVEILGKVFPALLAALPEGLTLGGALQIKEAALDGTPGAFDASVHLNADQSEIRWRKDFFKAAAVPLSFVAQARVAQDVVELRKGEIRLRDMTLAASGTIPLGRAGAVEMSFDSNLFAAGGWEKVFPAVEPYRLSGQTKLNGKVIIARKDGALRDVDLALECPLCAVNLRQWGKSVYLATMMLRVKAARDGRAAKATSAGPLPAWLPAPPSYSLAAAEILLSAASSAADRRDHDARFVDVKSAGEVALVGGKPVLRSQLSSRAGKVAKVDFKDFSSRLTLAEASLEFSDLNVGAFQGTLKAEGRYRFAGATPSFDLTSQIDGLDIPQFARVALGAEPKRLRGRMQMDLTLSGKGRSWEQMQPTLAGRGTAAVTQGALLNFNLAQQVLTKATGIVGLRSLVPGPVRQRYPRIFNARDTEFDELTGAFTLANRKAQLKNVVLSAADFGARGEGQVDLIGRLDFHGALLLSRQLTRDLTHAVGEAKPLAGKDGRLALPFDAAGIMPKVEVRPDLPAIGKSLGRGLLQRGLEALQKSLPLPDRKQNEEENEEENDRRDKRSPLEGLIRKGLDWLQRR